MHKKFCDHLAGNLVPNCNRAVCLVYVWSVCLEGRGCSAGMWVHAFFLETVARFSVAMSGWTEVDKGG